MKMSERLSLTLLALIIQVGLYGGSIFGCGGSTAALPSANAPSLKGVVHYMDDHLGNAHLLTDTEGNVLREESRYPYGLDKQIDAAAAASADYSYTGKEYDKETGLVYFGGRYYSPEMGRWITPDPLFMEEDVKKLLARISEFNLYAYVRNNPVNFIDGSGLFSIRVLGNSDFKRNQFTAVVYGKENQFLGAFLVGRNAVGKGPFRPGVYMLDDPYYGKETRGMIVPLVDPATGLNEHTNGRTDILIHSGAEMDFSAENGFKATLGCLRTSDADLKRTIDFFDPSSELYEHNDPNGNIIQINRIGDVDDSPPVPATPTGLDDWRY